MGVKAQWDDEQSQRVILFDFEGDWTWHECREAMQYAEFLIEDAPHKVSYVYDLTRNRLPQRTYLNTMQKLFTVELSPAPAKIVIVEKGHFVETLKDMLITALPQVNFDNIYFADSLARARGLVSS